MFIQKNDDGTFTVFSAQCLKNDSQLTDLGGMYWPKMLDNENKIFREGIVFKNSELPAVEEFVKKYYEQEVESVSTDNDLQLEDIYDLLQEMIDRVIRLEKHVYEADADE